MRWSHAALLDADLTSAGGVGERAGSVSSPHVGVSLPANPMPNLVEWWLFV